MCIGMLLATSNAMNSFYVSQGRGVHLQVGLEALRQRAAQRVELDDARQAIHYQHVAVPQLYARLRNRPLLHIPRKFSTFP